jgi:hypothetical protein
VPSGDARLVPGSVNVASGVANVSSDVANVVSGVANVASDVANGASREANDLLAEVMVVWVMAEVVSGGVRNVWAAVGAVSDADYFRPVRDFA